MRVVVVGGGVAGLSQVTQLSRLPQVASLALVAGTTRTAARFGLHTGLWNPALRVLNRLGLLKAIEAKGRYLAQSGYKAYDQKDASRWLMRPNRSLAASAGPDPALLFLPNEDLLSILQSATHPSTQLLASNLTGVDILSSQCTTSCGAVLPFDLLVAADGSHSAVRRLLKQTDKLVYRGYCVFRGHVSLAAANQSLSAQGAALLRQQAWQSLGPACRFAVVPTATGYHWYAAVTMPPPSATKAEEAGLGWGPLGNGTRAASGHELEKLQQALTPFHAPTLDLVLLTAPEAVSISPAWASASASSPPPSPLSGGVVFVGDASVTLDPILAVGAGVAIEDSQHVADAVAACANNPADIARFVDERRRGRLQRLAGISDLAQSVGHLRSAYACGARDGLINLAPHGLTGAALDAIIQMSSDSSV